ncbi:jg9244 [Pararge aegeria aegeria]|uniref:Jg9244 protein n=1 Tax=Pararge aegeria aegeria TaxID=348720 RepID=A0A8S4SM96_9NEOP|nr:jg9244 [Pararge aegeria aegeria]
MHLNPYSHSWNVQNERRSWQIEMDISAPQILFVEDLCDRDASVLVVDFGRLRLANANLPEEEDVTVKSQSVDEDEEMFMTPCSTPPGSLLSPLSPSSPPPQSRRELDAARLHTSLYDRYKIELSDLQILVGRVRDNWKYAHTKATSALHLLDRFSISLQSCVAEFQQYLANLARSIRAAAADMAIGLVQPRGESLYSNPRISQSMEGVSPRRRTASVGCSLDEPDLDSRQIILSVSVELESPVVVLPRAARSAQVFVAHLGRMSLANQPADPWRSVYRVRVRDISLVSRSLVALTFREFSLRRDRLRAHESTLQVSLHSITMEDLTKEPDSKHRMLMVSHTPPMPPKAVFVSKSCPDFVTEFPDDASTASSLHYMRPLSTSLPTQLNVVERISDREYKRSVDEKSESNCPTPPCSPERGPELDNLVWVSVHTRDPTHPHFNDQYKKISKVTKVEFNCLKLVLSIDSWVAVLDFFGVAAEEPDQPAPSANSAAPSSYASNASDEPTSDSRMPEMTVHGRLATLQASLDAAQYRLVRGVLTHNLAEPCAELLEPPLPMIPQTPPAPCPVWTTWSLQLDLQDVCVELRGPRGAPPLACINFIKSRLLLETYSDLAQDIDLVSQEILVSDMRYAAEPANRRGNVFSHIVQPMPDHRHSVQAEVHARKRPDSSAYTILVNNMRLMAILDWWEAANQFIMQPPPPAVDPDLQHLEELSADSVDGDWSGSGAGSPAPAPDAGQVELKLNITDSQLVLVEDASLWDTNAVILKSTTVITYRAADVARPVVCELNELEVFSCVLGLEEETALSIVEPAAVHAALHADHVLHVAVGTLNLRLSYHDMRMFAAMLQSLPAQARVALSVSGDCTRGLIRLIVSDYWKNTHCSKSYITCLQWAEHIAWSIDGRWVSRSNATSDWNAAYSLPFESSWEYTLSSGLSLGRVQVDVRSSETLDTNVTSALVDLVRLVRHNWTSDYYAPQTLTSEQSPKGSPAGHRRRSPFVPYALRNLTGQRLWFTTLTTASDEFCCVIVRERFPPDRGELLAGHTLTLVPALRVENLLPLELQYRADHVVGTLAPANTQPFHQVNVEEGVELCVKLEGFGWSTPLSVGGSTSSGSFSARLKLRDQRSRRLYLNARVTVKKTDGIKVSISAAYWIVNRTGLPLVLRAEGGAEAAGQFAEHEVARMVAPLPFSFADGDGPTVSLRLGSGISTTTEVRTACICEIIYSYQ